MGRALLIALLVVFFAITAVGAVLYMAYGISDSPPEEVTVVGLQDSTSVAVYRRGTADIRASSREDAYSALGYLHGQEHAWSMALWRRTALGTLSEWFGSALLPLDQLARRLLLGRLAQQAYGTLPDPEKRILEAYARGVSAAFALERTHLANEFVSLEVTPSAWEPWHSLAVERLFAWLSAERPNADSLRQSPAQVRAFFDSDRLLREWLHLHGFENGVMWSMQDSSGTRLIQRHVYGSSALPIYQPARLEWPGDSTIAGATLIGTPFMPVGRSGSHAWGILFSSSMDLARSTQDTSQIPVSYDRIRTGQGKEHLLRIRAGTEDLFFPASPRVFAGLIERADTSSPRADTTAPSPVGMASRTAPADTVARSAAAGTVAAGMRPSMRRPAAPAGPGVAGWALQWSGFRVASDVSAWLGLLDGGAPNFQLFEGDGMSLTRGGSVSISGNPAMIVPVRDGRFIGNTEWSAYAAQRIDSLSEPDVAIATAELISDRQSAWAAQLAPALTEAAIAVPEQPHLVTEALTYLRNWDFSYDRASIAASIFDRWMDVYQDSIGYLPTAEIPDTMLAQNLVRYETLVRAVEQLAERYGDDPSTWRWEIVEPHIYYFPARSSDTLVSGDEAALSSTRYAPITLPGSGHPTTVAFGPSPLAGELDSPAIWEAWISTSEWEAFRYRHRRFRSNRFFGRYLVSDRTPEPGVLPNPDQPVFSVQLVPR